MHTTATFPKPSATSIVFMLRSALPNVMTAAARKAGLGVDGPAPGSRQTPQGQLLRWRALTPTSPEFGLFIPFFIDWGDTVHPATTSRASWRF